MYLKWDEKIITDFSEKNIEGLYNQGYLFGRVNKGMLYQTRSLRIDLSKFELSSENRRVLKKTNDVVLEVNPIPFSEYHWSIGKLAKDFYETKFGEGTFSANKVKELLTNPRKSNFNLLFIYKKDEEIWGYAISQATENILHYCYPFYDLAKAPKDMGLGMMTKAVAWAKENNKQFVYLGSATRPNDTYKLQFAGAEWFDENNWSEDWDKLKDTLKK